MKRLITCLLALVMVLSAASCVKRTAKNSPEETFSTKDVSITLSTAFREVKSSDYTACYEASDVTVYMIKEPFADLTEEQAEITVLDYATLVRNNNISKNPGEVVSAENGLTYFEYSYQDPTDGKTYKTFSTMYKSTNAFWTVQFCCEEAIYAEYTELFTKWALSVFFTLKDMDYEVEELMITLTEGFSETNLEEFKSKNLVISNKEEELVANYISDDGKITINFKKQLKSASASKSLNSYATATHEKYELRNNLALSNITELSKENDLRSFEFEFTQTIPNPNDPETDTTSKYKYFVVCFEGKKSFWTVEFACNRNDFENYRESFIKWAQSLTTEKN